MGIIIKNKFQTPLPSTFKEQNIKHENFKNNLQMKKEIIENGLFIIGVILYNIIFWEEQMGLNTLLFAVFVIGSLFYLNPESRHSTIARLTALGTLFTALMVVFLNSQFSKVIHVLSMITMIGFIHQRELRFLWYGLLLTLINVFSTPLKLLKKFKTIRFGKSKSIGKVGRFVKLAILPMFFVGLFFIFYAMANSDFATNSFSLFEGIGDFFSNWNLNINPPKVIFFIGSLFIVGGMFWKTQSQWLVNRQMKHKDDIIRERKPKRYHFAKSPIALKNEYRSGLIMLVALNLLTLTVNVTDIQTTWIGFAKLNSYDIYLDVHFGAYVLIFTILMAIAVLLYFFRKNLNFYSKNKALKIAALAWIIQNMVLAFSVALRNIKYVSHYGLTYKRIGVFIFLGLVLYGLGTVIFKINEKKTAYYLFKHNAWSLYITLILLTSVNWDTLITKYNLGLQTNGQPDHRYLVMDLSDKNLPLLYENIHLFSDDVYYRPYSLKKAVKIKKDRFKLRKQQQSWLSWNYADRNTLLYLNKHQLAD